MGLKAIAQRTASALPGIFSPLTTTGLFTQAAEDSITAHAGGGKALATALSATVNLHRISVCATAGDSVLLPPALAGQVHELRNDGAAASQVFGQGTDTINGVATGTGVSLPAGQTCYLACHTAGAWQGIGVGPFTGTTITATVSASAVNYSVVGGGVYVNPNGAFSTYDMAFGLSGLLCPSTSVVRWSSGSAASSGGDTSLSRISAGVVGVGTGAAGSTAGSLSLTNAISAGYIRLGNFTVATLPAAATAGVGGTAFVTDASTTLILGLGLAVSGGGANKVPVYSDGTNWLYG